ncbi:MAG: cbb3-type cytochrome oxidase assembly protein CcoS [Parvibaculaceae bacterium]|nr:cbb3-type cytochrome oxidase assembly protein CcoS [Parvibaculaceae bacterium]
MNALLLLIPIALGLGILGLLAFLWSIKSGQFDDLEGAAERILYDDDAPLPSEGHAPQNAENAAKEDI